MNHIFKKFNYFITRVSIATILITLAGCSNKKVGATDAKDRKPFCLFISLVNPHDVWVYPTVWEKAGYKKEDFANMGIDLPDNYADDLKTKPSIQRKARQAYNKQFNNLLYKDISPETAAEANKLHLKLKGKIDQAAALPSGFPWPSKPF